MVLTVPLAHYWWPALSFPNKEPPVKIAGNDGTQAGSSCCGGASLTVAGLRGTVEQASLANAGGQNKNLR